MPSLFHTLGIGAESLYTTRQGVDTAGHNIANANVEGYSRQSLDITQRDPLLARGQLFGNGAYIKGVRRAHDQFVEKQLNRANQDVGKSSAYLESLRELEGIYSPQLAADLSNTMQGFFNSLQDLSSFPDDFTVRSNVVESARNLIGGFQAVDRRLSEARDGANERVYALTQDVNSQVGEIARLNIRIKEMEVDGQSAANDLRDQRDKLLRGLTKNIEVNYYEDQWGMVTVRGPKQVTLVEGGHAANVTIDTSPEAAGMYDVVITDSNGSHKRIVTDNVGAGSLSALIQVRDKIIPNLLQSNNKLAEEFANNFNAAHRQGFGIGDFSETTGLDFFKFDNKSVASTLDLSESILTSANAIAVGSTPNAPGDNINLNNMVGLKDQALMDNGNTTFIEFYANQVGILGLEVLRADHMKNADELLATELETRREAVSGVSMDEEAINLMKWQSNFTASSKVITTVDEMLETVLSIKR